MVIAPSFGPLRAIFIALLLLSAPALGRDAPKPTNNVLEAQFVSGSLDVDGEMEAAWNNAKPVRITHAYNPAMTGKPEAVYDVYYGGLKKMMPWASRLPRK